MIQRKQSIYLLIVVLSSISSLFLPLLGISVNDGLNTIEHLVSANGLYWSKNNEWVLLANLYPIMLLLLCLASISFVTIFVYSKRLLQIKLIRLCLLIFLLYCTVVLMYPEYVIGKYYTGIESIHFVLPSSKLFSNIFALTLNV